MQYTDYKFQPSYLAQRLSEVSQKIGGDAAATLKTMVAQTVKIVDAGGYVKFGPYWYAVKRILNEKAEGRTFGQFTSEWMADEYSEKNQDGTVDDAKTLVAAWEFYEDRAFVRVAPPEREFEIGGRAIIVFDEDLEAGH
jgi:hypothetical protein